MIDARTQANAALAPGSSGHAADAPRGSSRPRAVILLSGGLDSATVLAVARRDGFACHALSFDYGQRHRAELDAARRVADHLGVAEHRRIAIDPRAFASGGGEPAYRSALTGGPPVPKDRDESRMAAEIPVTYVPARNTIFLAYALAVAEGLGANDLYLGVNAVDYSGYPDCRPEYLRAFEALANLATKAGVEGRRLRVHAPLVDLTKAAIITLGLKLGVDYGLTHSCYDPESDGRPCRRCDACLLRQRAFEAMGSVDPLLARA